VSCNQDEEFDSIEPCISIPCGVDNSNWIEPSNRVASIPAFRKGRWINIKQNAYSRDTIIFHNDSLWSRRNSPHDLDYEQYKFDFLYFESRFLNYMSSKEGLHREITLYNDTTGIFSILYKEALNSNQDWDHYVKIE
jgi:hypothetical protein